AGGSGWRRPAGRREPPRGRVRQPGSMSLPSAGTPGDPARRGGRKPGTAAAHPAHISRISVMIMSGLRYFDRNKIRDLSPVIMELAGGQLSARRMATAPARSAG